MATQETEHLPKMDPELEAYLKTLPPGATDIIGGESDFPTMRAKFREAKKKMSASAGPPPAGIKEEDMTVKARDGYEIPIRTYKPQTPPTAGSPIVVVFHGGGYCLGDLYNEEMNCRNFTAELGAVCINVDYRLAPEHPFPVAANDAWDVVQWVAQNFKTLEADPSQGFLLFGVSAGASLSIIMSHLARDNKLDPPLTGLCLAVPLAFDFKNPPAEYKDSLKAYEENANAPFMGRALLKRFVDNYAYDGNSPLFTPFAGPKEKWNFKNLPPTASFVCGADPLRDDGLVYDQVLQENGVKTKLKVYPGLPHSFWSFVPSLSTAKKVPADFVEGVKWLLEQK